MKEKTEFTGQDIWMLMNYYSQQLKKKHPIMRFFNKGFPEFKKLNELRLMKFRPVINGKEIKRINEITNRQIKSLFGSLIKKIAYK